MGLIKEILRHEVFPAIGCTEPISCAYAAALAAHALGEPVARVDLRVDPGTFKNGAAVTVPYTEGATGNLIAAVIGAEIACPDSRLQILRETTPAILDRARRRIAEGACSIQCMSDTREFTVEVTVTGANHTARAVLAGGHTQIALLQRDGTDILKSDRSDSATAPPPLAYRQTLRGMPFLQLLEAAVDLDEEDLAFLRDSIATNEAIIPFGEPMRRVGYQIHKMREKGFLQEDLFFQVKSRLALAVDARMGGVNMAVMTSGGSGNQGLVVTITVSSVGQLLKVSEGQVLRGLAVAHAVNSYIKCFTGELAAICGCALGGGIAAACAMVYMLDGIHIPRMSLAINNVIGDLGGIICDGAKPGCALKAVSSADSAMRAAFMALEDHGLSADDGILADSPEASIRNLQQLADEGMGMVDPTVLHILEAKAVLKGALKDGAAR